MQERVIPVAAAVIMNGRDILVARRKESGTRGGKREFQGGKVEANEKPREALKRELREEFGSEAEILFRKEECPWE